VVDDSGPHQPSLFAEWSEAVQHLSKSELVRLAFERCHVMVFQTALRLIGSREEAEDVTQTVFESLLGRVGSVRQPIALIAYLKTSAVRGSLQVLRKRARQGGRLRVVLEAGLVTHTSAEAATAVAELRALLEGLPIEERAVVVLRYIEGHSLEEVAELMNLSLSTARRRLDSARARLRAHEPTDGVNALLSEMH
jgi:RNA polymerase sigma-70 factor, ECF subfamily